MFEKEAEEYAERTKTKKEIKVLNTVHDWGQESLSPDERRLFEGIQDRKEAREQGFQKGAEFGYKLAHEEMDYLNKHWENGKDKVNEWHYVKDGDLPKENKKYWILTSDGEPKVDSWLSISWATFYGVIAWKEIVLPELKENK